MVKTTIKRKNEAQNGISKRDIEVKNSYKMARTIKFNGISYKKDEQVEFDDKNIEKMFLKNNYII